MDGAKRCPRVWTRSPVHEGSRVRVYKLPSVYGTRNTCVLCVQLTRPAYLRRCRRLHDTRVHGWLPSLGPVCPIFPALPATPRPESPSHPSRASVCARKRKCEHRRPCTLLSRDSRRVHAGAAGLPWVGRPRRGRRAGALPAPVGCYTAPPLPTQGESVNTPHFPSSSCHGHRPPRGFCPPGGPAVATQARGRPQQPAADSGVRGPLEQRPRGQQWQSVAAAPVLGTVVH